jgi:GT2 family glycosyltransferase
VSADRSVSRLGIAVVTYRRQAHMQRLLGAIAKHTRALHHVVVAEDGGDDGSVQWCHQHGYTVVSGRNRGVAWNKNRGLFALAALACDPLLLLEDDVYPERAGWEREWIEGTRVWHHLAYLAPKVAKHTVAGAGTASDPWVNPAATAQCLSISAQVHAQVGYFDPRFQGWGHEHAEWTTRIKRAGYGFKTIELPDGRRPKAQLYLAGGLRLVKVKSFRDDAQAQRNHRLSAQLQDEPLLRLPWRDAHERSEFLHEQAVAGIEVGRLLDRLES